MQVVVAQFREHFHSRMCEWAFGSIMFSMGLVLLSPANTYSISAWGGIPEFLTEGMLGVIMIAGGLIRLIALAINGTWRPTPHIRAGIAGISSVLWLNMFFWIVDGNPASILVAIFPVLFAFDILNALRAAGDAAEIDRMAKHGGWSVGRGK